ncbi:ferritin-like domain-containing protein, partial [Burkholderia cepacia]
EQIRFDGEWEKKVVERILHNLSILFGRTFATAQELNRYRREVTARTNRVADGVVDGV